MSISDTAIIRIIIVEDHELARFGLTMALSDCKSVEVIGEAENGVQALALVKTLLPDVVLMDIGMPLMNGIEAMRQIKADYPDIKVVMLTSISNQQEVLAALTAGADAYCMKEIKIERLFQVLQMIMEGVIWLDPAIAQLVMQALPDDGVEAAAAERKPAPRKRFNADLTEREQTVLRHIVDGRSNKEIALSMSVTGHTVKAHVSNIIHKLSVDDRTQAAVKALREGLLDAKP